MTSPPPDIDKLDSTIRGLDLNPLSVIDLAFAFAAERPRAFMDLKWDGQQQRFAITYLPIGTPKRIAEAARDIREAVRDTPGTLPMLMCPYCPDDQIRQLMADGISAIDLSGNIGIVVPKRWFVIRAGNKNRYPSSAPIKNVYRGKSALVPRALLTRRRFETARELERDIGTTAPVTASTISKVLSSMREDFLVSSDGEIRVLQPEAILGRLDRNYEPVTARRTVRAKLALGDASALLERNASATNTLYAADATAQYTILPSTSAVTRIYTSSITSLTSGLTLDTDSRFPTVEFVETDDVTLFYGRTIIDGLCRTSKLQVYLELQAGDARAQQNAEGLRAELIGTAVKR